MLLNGVLRPMPVSHSCSLNSSAQLIQRTTASPMQAALRRSIAVPATLIWTSGPISAASALSAVRLGPVCPILDPRAARRRPVHLLPAQLPTPTLDAPYLRYPMTGEIREFSRRDKRRGKARTRVEAARCGDVDVIIVTSEWDEPHAGTCLAPSPASRICCDNRSLPAADAPSVRIDRTAGT